VSAVSPEVMAYRLAAISRVDERETLRSLQVPVMTLRARHDRLLSSRDTAKLRAVVPNGVHLDLDGPHLLLQMRPYECAALLRPPSV
jgi:pimeloyl-ACP methyl ester carboxylesterase